MNIHLLSEHPGQGPSTSALGREVTVSFPVRFCLRFPHDVATTFHVTDTALASPIYRTSFTYSMHARAQANSRPTRRHTSIHATSRFHICSFRRRSTLRPSLISIFNSASMSVEKECKRAEGEPDYRPVLRGTGPVRS